MKLTQTRLLVSDFGACFRFYRNVMGFRPTWGAEGEGYADFDAGGTSFALFQREAMSAEIGTAALPLSAPAQDRVMLVFEADDLDDVVERLRERGADIISGPRDFPDWGIRAAHLRDPDGNLIEINKPMPHEEWTEELRAEREKYEQ